MQTVGCRNITSILITYVLCIYNEILIYNYIVFGSVRLYIMTKNRYSIYRMDLICIITHFSDNTTINEVVMGFILTDIV